MTDFLKHETREGMRIHAEKNRWSTVPPEFERTCQ